jgi:hypothetical protein
LVSIVYNQLMTLYLEDLGLAETCACPRCGLMTNPEWLTSITKTGLVIGCANCVSLAARRDPAALAQLVREAEVSAPAKAWM